MAKEQNQVVAFTRISTLPAKLSVSKKTWTSEIPPKTEESPFPVHPEHPWRIAAMVTVGNEVQVYMPKDERNGGYEAEELSALRDAARILANESVLRVGLHRCWMLRNLQTDNKESEMVDEEEPGGDAEAELWMMRFASNQQGQKLAQAFRLAEQQNVVDKCLKASIRADRAPKGGLQRQSAGALGRRAPQARQEGVKMSKKH